MSTRSEEEQRAVRYYEQRLAEHGATAAGVDWRSSESQEQRFAELLRVVAPGRSGMTVNDFGCGYGALASHALRLPEVARYVGFDLSEAMIEAARQLHAGRDDVSFISDPQALEVADYTVASGVLNVRQETPEDAWWLYVQELLRDMARRSRVGFAFNVLTSFSDQDRKAPHLFYADPSVVLRHCQREFSRWVSLLHDYGLYEFTVLVRAETEGAWQT